MREQTHSPISLSREAQSQPAPAHPCERELELLLRGDLPRDEARAVVRHLLTDCPACIAITRRLSPPGDPLSELEVLVQEMVTGGEPLYEVPIHFPRRDANVSQGEEAARAELRAMVEELDGIRGRLVDLHDRLPVPAEETAMLVGEVEMDFPTLRPKLRPQPHPRGTSRGATERV